MYDLTYQLLSIERSLTSEGKRSKRLRLSADGGVGKSEEGAEERWELGEGVLVLEMEVSGVFVIVSSVSRGRRMMPSTDVAMAVQRWSCRGERW